MTNNSRHAIKQVPRPAQPPAQGLYDPAFEHDACGVGFLVNINGKASHTIIEQGIDILKNLLHRGATGADMNTGDGAGLLFQMPDRFLRKVCREKNIQLPAAGRFGTGMFFLPRSKSKFQKAVTIIEAVAQKENLPLLGRREVPVDPAVLGDMAREEMPAIQQMFFDGGKLSGDALERRLYILRKQIEKEAATAGWTHNDLYVCSLSSRTIVYKGLMQATQVADFYPDLCDHDMESALAVVHQRYSTNTFPSWPLSQPFRYLAHNGEINTVRGNLNNMSCREQALISDVFGEDIKKILPVCEAGVSDSANLDNGLEMLTRAGRSIEHSMIMMIPQAWGEKYPIGQDLRGFFEYHAGLMEPWDGPAAVAFTDGRRIGALLDRNGLRPARYTITRDGFMVFASEAGVLDLPPENICEKGALRPGQMILIDLEKQRVLHDAEIKMALARRKPYRRWVQENRIDIHGFFNAVAPVGYDPATLKQRQQLFGYTREDEKIILGTMAESGQEPKGSMGADQPLAVLSEKPQLLYWYFKQMFAQVTNPAIDPIREELVMSLMTFIGNPEQILLEVPQHARLIKLRHPVLSNEDLKRIRSLPHKDFQSRTVSAVFPAGGNGAVLTNAVNELCEQAEKAVSDGVRVLIISDKVITTGNAPLPMLLAVAAVHRHLVRKGLRTRIGILAETGEVREVMHLALLLGYGASAINPYLAFETISHLVSQNLLENNAGSAQAIENYTKALCGGLLKIMSKMGISTLRSYRSAQIFEAIGLNSDVVNTYFTGTPSRIEGLSLDDIAHEVNLRYEAAHDTGTSPQSRVLPDGGQYKFRHEGERHMWTPATISLLQQATRENNPDKFAAFAQLINDQHKHQTTLRGLLEIKACENKPIPLSEVEPAAEIVKRFATGAMSFGSLSRETHETLAIAMNRMGAMSNSGEGGEDPARYIPLPNGDSRCSMVKQVASGRFGVTAEYLVNCRELQIKIAQGAKPGEGGHLPGHKVNREIARVRNSTPGVTLISPPPHHDIYSIEDIAQLIYDLKNANPQARIAVKLVSESGVGTVAAGVAKGHADMILVSGYDGGTGASPLSSIKHTGMPWELGLAETQQTLMLNGLRSRVRLQTDGQLRTGRDVLIAALLGAEEFGFATAPLVVCGCVMMRKCHNNTCPVGVATQDPELRKRFSGRPEYIENYFHFVAEELRGYMAQLGIRTVDELVGRSDLLETGKAISFWKARGIDLSKILYQPDSSFDTPRCITKQDHALENALDQHILKKTADAISSGRPVTVELPIRNIHRTVGTITSSRIAARYGNKGLPEDTVTLRFNGTAGQSFAAFASRGMTFWLKGEANDYLGKGLSGARIIVTPPAGSTFQPAGNMIAGNVLLYGATAGEVYLNGRAGERFAIRNSGAYAVVEGVGDHGCEYMTGGRVLVLGPTGVNFGAGMSGGIAYVYDETGLFDDCCNLEMIDLEMLTDKSDIKEVRDMLKKHRRYTNSERAKYILENWDDCLGHFIKVIPMEYKLALGQLMPEDEATERTVMPDE